jgi:uncharacterized protein YuzE
MRIRYHKDTDSLYIHLVERPGTEAREVAAGVVVDFDADGKPVGIDIERAQGILDLATLSVDWLPLQSTAA